MLFIPDTHGSYRDVAGGTRRSSFIDDIVHNALGFA